MIADIPILAVWFRLGGTELSRGRAPAFWRGSNDLNLTFSLKLNRFFDHARCAGGGPAALVQAALQCDQCTAVRWLQREGFVESKPMTLRERREYALRRRTAARVAREIGHWRVALAAELNTRKVSAAERGDFDELARTAPLCHLLENGSPEALASEFARQRQADPRGTARLTSLGSELETEAQRLAAAVVCLLSTKNSGACYAA